MRAVQDNSGCVGRLFPSGSLPTNGPKSKPGAEIALGLLGAGGASAPPSPSRLRGVGGLGRQSPYNGASVGSAAGVSMLNQSGTKTAVSSVSKGLGSWLEVRRRCVALPCLGLHKLTHNRYKYRNQKIPKLHGTKKLLNYILTCFLQADFLHKGTSHICRRFIIYLAVKCYFLGVCAHILRCFSGELFAIKCRIFRQKIDVQLTKKSQLFFPLENFHEMENFTYEA